MSTHKRSCGADTPTGGGERVIPAQHIISPAAPIWRRSIGVVGGLGPAATADLLRHLAVASARHGSRRDQEHPEVIVMSRPGRIADRTAYLLGKEHDNPGRAIATVVRDLIAAGSGAIGIPCNTAHAPEIFELINVAVPRHVTLVNMVAETTIDVAAKYPGATVGILSTDGTRRTGVYCRALLAQGMTYVAATPATQVAVDRAIYDPCIGVKAVGHGTRESRRLLREAAGHMHRAGADVLLLACTELPLVTGDVISLNGLPVVNPAYVLAEALLHLARQHLPSDPVPTS